MKHKVMDLYTLLLKFKNTLSDYGSDSKNIDMINDLTQKLKFIKDVELDDFLSYLSAFKGKKLRIAPRYKNKQPDFKEIDSIYKKIQARLTLNKIEDEHITWFEQKYPLIREFIGLDYKQLYEKLSQNNNIDLPANMLKFLLFHYFDIESKSKKKEDLLNDLRKNIYNADYMDSLRVSERKGIHQAADRNKNSAE